MCMYVFTVVCIGLPASCALSRESVIAAHTIGWLFTQELYESSSTIRVEDFFVLDRHNEQPVETVSVGERITVYTCLLLEPRPLRYL